MSKTFLQIPKPITETIALNSQAWKISLYEEYLPLFKNAQGEFDSEILVELEKHLHHKFQTNFRLQLHLKTVPFLVGFLVSEREIAIGSTRLARELFLLDQKVPGVYSWHLLEEHVEKIRSIDIHQSPTLIEQITERHQLPNFFEDEGLQAICEKSRELEEKLLKQLKAYHPTLFERISDFFLKLTANYCVLRIHLLKFIAMLPSLDHDKKGVLVKKAYLETLRRLIQNSKRTKTSLPSRYIFLARLEHFFAKKTPAKILAANIRFSVRTMAKRFIAGESIEKAEKVFKDLKKTNRDITLDQLGEQVVSEKEADQYQDQVLKLIRGLKLHVKRGERNRAGIQRAHLSIKVSALASDFRPQASEYTYELVAPRLKKILLEAKAHDVFINIDAEHYPYRDLVFYIYKRVLLETPELKNFQATGIALQAYLRDSFEHFEEILSLAKTREISMPIRLVKGAYWDQETIEAKALGFDAPEFLNKEETDIHFRQLLIKTLEAAPHLQLCLGSHNLADHCFAETIRKEKFPHASVIEHQCLHRTYEALSEGMAKMGWAVRNYVPIGSLLVGMAYLVRRILENSSQVGILVQMRETKEKKSFELPHLLHQKKKKAREMIWDPSITELKPDFFNTIPLRFYVRKEKECLDQAFENFTKTKLGEDLSQSDYAGETHPIYSPSSPETKVGSIRYATLEDAKRAIDKASEVYNQGEWAKAKPIERASVLLKAASLMLLKRLELTSLIVHEGGKNFYEAINDVNEAIDFLNYYAREEVRLSQEDKNLVSRGVFGVISPWNFPLAIPAGMAVGALAAGNTVLLKPAEHTPLITQQLGLILHEAGVPKDVFIHLPGKGSEVGKILVEHPKIAGIVFTGSKEVGIYIAHTAGKRIVHNELFHFDTPVKAITEMGGKNAVIVTATAELDETVAGILYSAFGNAGQKCSAASRILVDNAVKEKLAARLKEACRDIKVGLAFDHATMVNPLIARKEKERLQKEAEEVIQEATSSQGKILIDRSKENLPGHCMGPLLVELPSSSTFQKKSFSRKELFGPILHFFGYSDLEEAIQLFNATEYGLTGGIFSQSQDEVEYLSRYLEAGNIYVNRPITGARVAIEPFGGFKLSGTGPKVGSPFYLEAFHYPLEPKAISIDVEAISQYKTLIEKAYPFFKNKFYWNRKIPGQRSFNDLNFIKEKGLYIALEGKPNAKTFLYFLAAVTVGSTLTILCKKERAYPTWLQIVEGLFALGVSKEKVFLSISDGGRIEKTIRQEEANFVIVEGDTEEVKSVLNWVYNGVAEERHLRFVLTKLDAPHLNEFEQFLEKFVEVRSFAINTMRYGAPLEMEL